MSTAAPTEIFECKHAVYLPPTKEMIAAGKTDDYHFVKLQKINPDGTSEPVCKLIPNFKRSYWITKEYYRKSHVEKKEFEQLSRVDERRCREYELPKKIAQALGQSGFRGSYKKLLNSPYVYGVDIPSTSVLKHTYNAAHEKRVASSVAVFDVETNMFTADHEVMLASITYKHRSYMGVLRQFFNGHVPDGIANPDAYIIQRIKETCDKWLSEDYIKRGIALNVELFDNEIDLLKSCIEKAHAWKPDVLGGWNVIFDIEAVVKACKRAGVNARDVFSDPSVPEEYRYFEIHKPNPKRETAAGKVKPLSPHELWVTVIAPASFEIQDTMRMYKFIRTGQPDQLEYSLDFTLKNTIKRGKLKMGLVNTEDPTLWHELMQRHYPFEYCAYNQYDCIGPEMLDEFTKDHAFNFPSLSGDTEYKRATSVPKRQLNYYHYLALEKGQVIAATGEESHMWYSQLCMSVRNWIVMLDPFYMTNDGARCVEENPYISTNVYIANADIDVSGAYPTVTIRCNVSRDTQTKFVRAGEGLSEITLRYAFLNYSGGYINSQRIMRDIMDFPTLEETLDAFDAEIFKEAA